MEKVKICANTRLPFNECDCHHCTAVMGEPEDGSHKKDGIAVSESPTQPESSNRQE